MKALILTILAMTMALPAQAARPDAKALHVYMIDVEGGQATLIVTPSGESLLIDTGWPGHNGRDADRIVDAMNKAGVKKIDTVLITHYHVDHAGGFPQLLERIPVGKVIDHGPNRETDNKITPLTYDNYLKAVADKKVPRITVYPGDALPVKGITATVVSADGKLIQHPLAGVGSENPHCDFNKTPPPDKTENSRSIGVQIVFGKLRLLDLADLTRDKEIELMCPQNPLGTEDVWIVSHHGLSLSSSATLVDAIRPRVALMNNGAKKGGSPAVLYSIKKVPGLETLWQLHYSDEGGERNAAKQYIANPESADGNMLEVIAYADGSFDVVNDGNGLKKHYAAR